jgi:phosphoribosylglycinamide formyltransferase-1
MAERLASFVSGGGTTMQEIGRAYKRGEIPIELVLVIASNPTAGGIEKASGLKIPYVVVNPDDFRGEDKEIDQEGFGLELRKRLREKGVTAITQNGWLPKTPSLVIDEYRETIFNQHPGPKKETRATHGIQPHAIVLYIAQRTGRNMGTEVTTHRVNEKWDDGPQLE